MAERQSLVIVYTGEGKGKTTAALGLLLRAWGRGLRVGMFQFIKSTTSNYGETRAAKRLGLELVSLGGGFTWLSKDIDRDRALAEQQWARCREHIASGEFDVVILDEFTYPLAYRWLPVDEVIDFLRQRPAGLHIVITGRDAPSELIDFADLVTEMRELKHPFQRGVKAQAGIDF